MLNNNGNRFRTPIIYLLILAVIIFLASGFDFSSSKAEEVSYMDFLASAEKGEISAVKVSEQQLIGLKKDSQIKPELFPAKYDFYTTLPSQYRFEEDMAIIAARKTNKSAEEITTGDYGFDYIPAEPEKTSIWEIILPYIIIFGAFGLFFYFMMQAQGGGNKVMSFGKSRARVQTDMKNRVTFADVAGEDEEKAELMEVVDFMRNPKRFTAMGARIPKGVLLVGPPGTGKTLLAKACAGEADVPFYSISGSDFVEMFVGVGASRVRDLFTTAKKTAPAVIFIDEIDAVGRQRGAGLGGGHDEREQTLNQLLVEMDGFAVNEGIIVIAATNRPDILDPALLRPGRFDRQITVNYPDVKGREEILKVHAKGKPLAPGVDLAVLAKRTSGFTGADLENVLNEAAILTARFKKKFIDMPELEEAITRTMVGPEKRSRVITDEDKRITAYHEAGHAIVAHCLPNCDPVHEVSIIPRGQAAGYTMIMPDNDNSHVSRNKILDQICMSMGGRVAESLALDDICTGAIADLKQATESARKMVIEYGMSEEIGPIFLGGDTEVFIAKEWGHQRNYSETVASRIDQEIRRILEEQYARAEQILKEHSQILERLAKTLLEFERITGEEFVKVFNGEDVHLVTYREQQEKLMQADEEVLEQEEKERQATKEAQDAERPSWGEPEDEGAESKSENTQPPKDEN